MGRRREHYDAKGAIVVGGHAQGLGLIRSLAAGGIPSFLVDRGRVPIAGFSKHCRGFRRIPGGDASDELVSVLLALADSEGLQGWLLLPTGDADVAALSKAKVELERHYLVPVPDWSIVEIAYNKVLTNKLALEIGLPVPLTLCPDSAQQVSEWSSELVYPVLLKPGVMHTFYSVFKRKVMVAHSANELLSMWEAVSERTQDPLMIQEIITGPNEGLCSFCSFFRDGEVLGSCTGRRRRQIPMDFGKASTYVESVHIPELESMSVRLLRAMDYYGLSEVEFKWDSSDKEYKLLEVNPRTWKWHTLALRGGVNLPLMLYDDMHGRSAGRGDAARTGVAWVDFYTDFYVSLKEVLAGRMRLRDYVKSMRAEKEFAVADLRDPFPFIMETLLLAHLWSTR